MTNKFKLKDRVTLSKQSLYARKAFQIIGNGHLKLGEVGVIVKVLEYMQEGQYTVKFKDGDKDKTNDYFGSMLNLVK